MSITMLLNVKLNSPFSGIWHRFAFLIVTARIVFGNLGIYVRLFPVQTDNGWESIPNDMFNLFEDSHIKYINLKGNKFQFINGSIQPCDMIRVEM
jgi:hypothetical protein